MTKFLPMPKRDRVEPAGLDLRSNHEKQRFVYRMQDPQRLGRMKHAARNKLILHGQAEVFEQGMTEDNLELDMNVMDQARDLIPPEKTRDRRMIASRGVWPLLEPERE